MINVGTSSLSIYSNVFLPLKMFPWQLLLDAGDVIAELLLLIPSQGHGQLSTQRLFD